MKDDGEMESVPMRAERGVNQFSLAKQRCRGNTGALINEPSTWKLNNSTAKQPPHAAQESKPSWVPSEYLLMLLRIASPIPKVPLPPFLHSNPDAVRDDRGGQERAQRRVRGGERHQNGQLRSQRTGSTVDLRADETKQSEAFPTRWLKSRDGATARVPSLESREAKKRRDSHRRPRKKCKADKLHYKEENQASVSCAEQLGAMEQLSAQIAEQRGHPPYPLLRAPSRSSARLEASPRLGAGFIQFYFNVATAASPVQEEAAGGTNETQAVRSALGCFHDPRGVCVKSFRNGCCLTMKAKGKSIETVPGRRDVQETMSSPLFELYRSRQLHQTRSRVAEVSGKIILQVQQSQMPHLMDQNLKWLEFSLESQDIAVKSICGTQYSSAFADSSSNISARCSADVKKLLLQSLDPFIQHPKGSLCSLHTAFRLPAEQEQAQARLNPQPAKLGELALALSLFKAQLSNPGVTEVCSLTCSRRGRGRMSKRNENGVQGRAMHKGQSVKQTASKLASRQQNLAVMQRSANAAVITLIAMLTQRAVTVLSSITDSLCEVVVTANKACTTSLTAWERSLLDASCSQAWAWQRQLLVDLQCLRHGSCREALLVSRTPPCFSVLW
ncbi:hypothetical protein Anapl_15265 [Anas platyrhynchos]|uniref:Uncharacterized protein n=1 Tax=Anas platyrhynchos TaxID=8839 RepID=R0LCD2_ANAPL|nr:hypothetical protein Anapl_15265 [Anas platyrhynchos]